MTATRPLALLAATLLALAACAPTPAAQPTTAPAAKPTAAPTPAAAKPTTAPAAAAAASPAPAGSPAAKPAASPAAAPAASPAASPAAAASPAPAPTFPAVGKPDAPGLTTVNYGSDFVISGAQAPLFVAIEKGYYAEVGLNLKVTRGTGSAAAVQSVATGQFDIVEGDIGTAMLQRANQGAMVRVISPKYGAVPFAILSYEDQGIRTPKDLEGKTVADAVGSAPRVLFPAFARLAGIDPNRVTYRSVDAPVRNTLMGAGQLPIISAFILNLADVEKVAAEQQPGRRITALLYKDYGLDMYGNGYITSDRFLAEKPQVVRGFLQATIRGMRDTYRDIPGSVEILRKYHPEIDAQVARRALELIQPLVITEDMQRSGIGSFVPARMEKTKEIMREYFQMRDIPVAETYSADLLPNPPVLP